MNISDYKPKQVTKYAEQLGRELELLSQRRTEKEFEELLADEVLPELMNHDVYGETVLNKMELVHTVHLKSILEEKRLSVSGGVSMMNISSVNWLIELVHLIERYADERECRVMLMKRVNELKDMLLCEMGERSQLIESELKQHINID